MGKLLKEFYDTEYRQQSRFHREKKMRTKMKTNRLFKEQKWKEQLKICRGTTDDDIPMDLLNELLEE